MLHPFPRLAAILVLAAAAAAPARSSPPAERLLAEPLWVLRSADGNAAHVWFTVVEGHLAMSRCDTLACHRVTTAPAPLAWRELGASVYAAPDGGSLVPAWMVPTSGSRRGP